MGQKRRGWTRDGRVRATAPKAKTTREESTLPVDRGPNTTPKSSYSAKKQQCPAYTDPQQLFYGLSLPHSTLQNSWGDNKTCFTAGAKLTVPPESLEFPSAAPRLLVVELYLCLGGPALR